MELSRADFDRLNCSMHQAVANHPDQEDICQEAWLSWIRKAKNEDRLDSPPDRALICDIARKRAIDNFKVRIRQPAVQLDVCRVEPEEDQEPRQLQLSTRFWDLICNRLNSADRSLLRLRFVHGQTFPEIASITGGTADRVRKRIASILKMLRQNPSIRSLRDSA